MLLKPIQRIRFLKIKNRALRNRSTKYLKRKKLRKRKCPKKKSQKNKKRKKKRSPKTSDVKCVLLRPQSYAVSPASKVTILPVWRKISKKNAKKIDNAKNAGTYSLF